MRTVVKILCTVFLCLASSSLAWAAGDQKTQNRTMLYTSLFGGFAWPGTIGVNPQTGLSDRDVNAGLIYGLKIGFTPPPAVTWVGWELEASRSSQGVQQLAAGYATSSNVDVTTVAFNFILRYPGMQVQPYAGIGPSINWLHSYAFGGSDTSMGINFLAGVRLPITERFLVFTELKYNRVDFELTAGQYRPPQEFRMPALVAGVTLNF